MKKENFKLQFITHSNDAFATAASVREVLEGGCRWIQLRMKESTMDDIIATASLIQFICLQYHATFIIDDHVELVRKVGADGVHLGLKDMPIREARRILGDKYIIGGTANTFCDLKKHYDDGADYIGCGPFRYTTTKKNLAPLLGLDGYMDINRQMKENDINIPVVAIGGITFTDIDGIMSTGVDGIAISGGIMNAMSPREETKRIINQIEKSIIL